MCDTLEKRRKRMFFEAWLHDDRYKSWIRKVPSDDSLFHCTICNKNFSCNSTHISRHANSRCHLKNYEQSTSLCDDHDDDSKKKTGVFKTKWLEIYELQLWLREVPNNNSLCLCSICDKSFAAHFSHIRRHAKSESHINLCTEKGIELRELNDIDTQNNESPLSFDNRIKAAEIRFAALIAEKNIPHRTAKEILNFFQQVGEDPNVLKGMSMGRTKCSNIISNVLGPVENEHVIANLQNTKFSVFIDETSDICNEKWMTFFVRYVDSDTQEIRSQLLKLINIDATNCCAEKLCNAFKNEMWKLQIPFQNIVALSCDNASVMIGKHLSFYTKLKEMCKQLLLFPCPCHSSALIAHAACAKIPSYCDEFIKKIAFYINSSPKRTAIFHELCDCFQEKYRKILRLSDTRWLSHYTCVERLLQSWPTIIHFLQEMVVSEKCKSALQLLSVIDNVELKAYFLFLKYVLNFFNAFNAFFQSTETRVHLLQLKSRNFLLQICRNFIKKEYLKDVATNINFAEKENQKDINDIFLGSECEEYLDNLLLEGHIDTVTQIRQHCLQCLVTAAGEIRKRLPLTDDFLGKLQVFIPSAALLDSNRNTPFEHVSFIAKTIGGFDEESLKYEWFSLALDFTAEEKQILSVLAFDEMWKKILQRQLPNNDYKYPNLRNLLSAVRSLPNSNADPERTFSLLTALKSKTRNKLSSTCVNATCVLQSALRSRGETGANLVIKEQHLSRMLSDNLYATCPTKKKPTCTLYADNETPSCSYNN